MNEINYRIQQHYDRRVDDAEAETVKAARYYMWLEENRPEQRERLSVARERVEQCQRQLHRARQERRNVLEG